LINRADLFNACVAEGKPQKDVFGHKTDMMKTALSDLRAALRLLSRLPVPAGASQDMQRGAASMWALPLAGAVIGAIAALAGSIAAWLGLPPSLQAALILSTLIIITGALHEDGLADSADGLWGGWDRDRRLGIMKDSRIGSYGVIALVLSLLIRWAALSALLSAGASPWLVVGVAALSRAPMVATMALLPGARDHGMSASAGRPGPQVMWLALGTGAIIALLSTGFPALWAVFWVAAAAAGAGLIAQAKIGGQTGDILGATQQLAEIAALLSLCATLIP